MTSQLVAGARQTPTMVVIGAGLALVKRDELRSAGCEVVEGGLKEGRIDVAAWLAEMGRRRWTNILVEGGGAVLGSFFDAGCIDEAHVFLAPRIFGGAGSSTPVGGIGLERIRQAGTWIPMRLETLQGDVYFQVRRDSGSVQ